jgi:archaemetzincin
MKIYLLPLGPVDQGLIDYLLQRLSAFWDVKLCPPLDVRPDAHNDLRNQFDGSMLLRSLPDRGEIILGVTEADTYVEGLNFIFGLASGNRALISLKRLRPEFYGHPPDEEFFRLRAFKEAVHELGHVFGLGHCPNQKCVMHFSNTLSDTDRKDWRYCKQCTARLSSLGIL